MRTVTRCAVLDPQKGLNDCTVREGSSHDPRLPSSEGSEAFAGDVAVKERFRRDVPRSKAFSFQDSHPVIFPNCIKLFRASGKKELDLCKS